MYGNKMFRGVGYPTPLSVPVERACRSALIPADAAWFGVFMGLMETLTHEENWQQFEGGISREDAACYWQEIVDSLYASAEGEGECVSCCPTFRRNPATNLPEVSYDDGLTWDYFPDGPYEGADGPPIAPTPAALNKGSEDLDKCFAAWNAASVIAEFYRQTVGAVAAGSFNAVLSINIFLQQLNMALFSFIYPTESQIAQALGFFNTDWGSYATAPTLDDDQMEDLRCLLLMYASETDGIVTFDKQAIVDNCVATFGVNPGVALQVLINYMDNPGLNYAGGVQSNETADCSTCGGWCYEEDYTTGEGTFIKGNSSINWVSGQGWEGPTFGSGSYSDLFGTWSQTWPIGTTVEVTFTKPGGSGAANVSYLRFRNGTTVVNANDSNPTGTGVVKSLTSTGAANNVYIDINTGNYTGGRVYMTHVKFYGDNAEDNPFGESNC